jgi:hypothetical protein
MGGPSAQRSARYSTGLLEVGLSLREGELNLRLKEARWL